MTAPPRQRGLARIFFAPALMALCIASGLVSALLGDGFWDVISWVALLVPLAAIAYRVLRQVSFG